jgi:hypothetical protein
MPRRDGRARWTIPRRVARVTGVGVNTARRDRWLVAAGVVLMLVALVVVGRLQGRNLPEGDAAVSEPTTSTARIDAAPVASGLVVAGRVVLPGPAAAVAVGEDAVWGAAGAGHPAARGSRPASGDRPPGAGRADGAAGGGGGGGLGGQRAGYGDRAGRPGAPAGDRPVRRLCGGGGPRCAVVVLLPARVPAHGV